MTKILLFLLPVVLSLSLIIYYSLFRKNKNINKHYNEVKLSKILLRKQQEDEQQ